MNPTRFTKFIAAEASLAQLAEVAFDHPVSQSAAQLPKFRYTKPNILKLEILKPLSATAA